MADTLAAQEATPAAQAVDPVSHGSFEVDGMIVSTDPWCDRVLARLQGDDSKLSRFKELFLDLQEQHWRDVNDVIEELADVVGETAPDLMVEMVECPYFPLGYDIAHEGTSKRGYNIFLVNTDGEGEQYRCGPGARPDSEQLLLEAGETGRSRQRRPTQKAQEAAPSVSVTAATSDGQLRVADETRSSRPKRNVNPPSSTAENGLAPPSARMSKRKSTNGEASSAAGTSASEEEVMPKSKRARTSKAAPVAKIEEPETTVALIEPEPVEAVVAAPPPIPMALRDEDKQFFDEVARHLGEKSLYVEFLKLLNLFTQRLIELPTLMARARVFLCRDAGLWQTFCTIVGHDPDEESKASEEAGEPMSGSKLNTTLHEIPLGRVPEHGPSYRRLTHSEATTARCSGRDEHCQSVLNDEFVCAPNWTSEEGFIPGKKNAFEDALMRTEEDRYTFDMRMQANLQVLDMLAKLNEYLENMPKQEKPFFKLKTGIMEVRDARRVKRVYGPEPGNVVMGALEKSPIYVVPTLLKKLREKAVSWKEALAEWNGVWRDLDNRSFYKALDHKGINVKLVDKKNVTPKALVADIELIRREQQSAREKAAVEDVTTAPRYQLKVEFGNLGCLVDVLRLLIGYIDRLVAPHSETDKDRMEAFIRLIASYMLGVPQTLLDTHFPRLPPLPVGAPVSSARGTPAPEGESDTEAASSPAATGSEAPSAAATEGAPGEVGKAVAEAFGKRSHKKGAAELRRKAIRNNTSAAPNSRVSRRLAALAPRSPAPSSTLELPGEGGETSRERIASLIAENLKPGSRASSPLPNELWSANLAASTAATIIAAGASNPELQPTLSTFPLTWPANAGEDDRLNIFCHSTMYNIIRLISIVYERLWTAKQAALSGPPGVQITAYEQGLELCERYFSNEMNAESFEDQARALLGAHAWPLYTLDKLLGACTRLIASSLEAGTAMSERHDRVMLYLHNNRLDPSRQSPINQIAYRHTVETALGGDQNLFRITWHALEFQLLGKDELNKDEEPTARPAWERYLLSYVTLDTTIGLQRLALRPPALRRHLAAIRTPANDVERLRQVRGSSKLELKVCMRSYRLFYGPETEDSLVYSAAITPTVDTSLANVHKARFETWVEKTLQANREWDAARDAELAAEAAEAAAAEAAASSAQVVVQEATPVLNAEPFPAFAPMEVDP